MQEPPVRQNDRSAEVNSNQPAGALLPDDLPPTLRRLRGDPSQSMLSNTFDPIPYELEQPATDAPLLPDVNQPSAQMRALRPQQLAIATAIITSSFFVSRLLGILRVTIFASTFGNGADADAYTYAFILPNAVYNIVAGGALSSAFIPIFTEYMITRRDRKTAWYITSAVFNITAVMLIGFAVLGAIFMPALAHYFALPIVTNPKKHDEAELIINLSRLMLVQPILLGLSVLSTSVLQARQRFLLPAIGSALYNVGLILGIYATVLDSNTRIFGGHLGIWGPTWGVIAAALLQLVIQVPGLVRGKMIYTLNFDFRHPGVVSMFKMMIPRIVNAVMVYVVAAAIFGDLLGTLSQGAVFGYQQAVQLTLLPIGIFGISLSQAAFPSLASFVAAKDWDRVRTTVLSAVRIILFLSIPTSLGMIVLAEPITRLLLVHGKFTEAQAASVYLPLIYLSIGTPALALIEILVRAYFALRDATTAVTIGIIELFFAIALGIILIGPMGASGIGLANALGYTLEAWALLMILRPRIGGFSVRPLINFIAGVVAASLVATLATLLAYTFLEVLARPLSTSINITVLQANLILLGELATSSIVGAGVYWLAAKFLGIENTLPVDRIVARVTKRIRRR